MHTWRVITAVSLVIENVGIPSKLVEGIRLAIQISCPSNGEKRTRIEAELHRRHGSPAHELLGSRVLLLASFSIMLYKLDFLHAHLCIAAAWVAAAANDLV